MTSIRKVEANTISVLKTEKISVLIVTIYIYVYQCIIYTVQCTCAHVMIIWDASP